jgi:hypothetical protein
VIYRIDYDQIDLQNVSLMEMGQNRGQAQRSGVLFTNLRSYSSQFTASQLPDYFKGGAVGENGDYRHLSHSQIRGDKRISQHLSEQDRPESHAACPEARLSS